jgi:hypothetical protein
MPEDPNKTFSPMGVYVAQSSGYRAFIPAELPPKPPLRLEGDLLMLHSAADRAIGRLDAATATSRMPVIRPITNEVVPTPEAVGGIPGIGV